MSEVPAVSAVAAYFADDVTRTYQLMPWLPVLEVLDARHPVVLVLRDPASADLVRGRTRLPVELAPSLDDLTTLYDRLDPAVVVYCNNSPLNFQSLLHTRALHVHAGHGESDKQSMASNNAKAYDRVLVAGEAAVHRHVDTLLEYDAARLVRVGRPQLDVGREPVLAPTGRRTVLYAPTWEGDAAYNDYTSVVRLGRAVVEAVLAVPDVRLVYKPHPQVVASRRPDVRAAHQDLLTRVAAADAHDPAAGHVAVTRGDVLAVIPSCDAMVTDVSAVGLDWLYLRHDKPLFVTDPHDDAERLRREVPVSRCADVVDAGTVTGLTGLLTSRLAADEHRIARVAMRRWYFDDVQVGESLDRFLGTVDGLVELRDRLLGVTGDAGALPA